MANCNSYQDETTCSQTENVLDVYSTRRGCSKVAGLNLTLGWAEIIAEIASIRKRWRSLETTDQFLQGKNLLIPNLQNKAVSLRFELKPWVKPQTLG